jgi:hypothetical protein
MVSELGEGQARFWDICIKLIGGVFGLGAFFTGFQTINIVLARLGFSLIFLGLFLTGCTSPYAAQSVSPSPTPVPVLKTKVLVLSEPAGARIQVNQDYIGDAPIEVKVESNALGYFTRPTSFIATPGNPSPGTTLYVQSKFFLPADPIPKRLFFDNRLVPLSPQ